MTKGNKLRSPGQNGFALESSTVLEFGKIQKCNQLLHNYQTASAQLFPPQLLVCSLQMPALLSPLQSSKENQYIASKGQGLKGSARSLPEHPELPVQDFLGLPQGASHFPICCCALLLPGGLQWLETSLCLRLAAHLRVVETAPMMEHP